jgi:hypothetical protein
MDYLCTEIYELPLFISHSFLGFIFVLKTYFPHFETTVFLFIVCIINIAMDGHFKITQCNGNESACHLTLFVKHKLNLPNCLVDITAFIQINMHSRMLMFY